MATTLQSSPILPTTPVGIEVVAGQLRYRDSATATLNRLNLTLPAGRWSVLLGRSGCGKTTVLRYLAGLLDEQVYWQGELKTSDGKPLLNRVAYMAQQDLLLPWLNVVDNVCLSERFLPKAAKSGYFRAQALALLSQVGLADYALAMPDQLSGGMRQRVALARTLMQDKPVVLMDEPFSALDAVTRYKLQQLAAELLQHKTVILITHDPQEAVRLAHTLYVLKGSPSHAYALEVPNSAPPRQLDAECAQLQQQILHQLGLENE
nr:ABC transporter ATP-binding protein [Vibrio hippocampi]